MKCTLCGSTRIAPIRYGLPDFTEEVVRQMENEEVYFGGCMILPGYPHFHCFACDRNIASRPVLRSKQGLEDYRKIVTGIRFAAGSTPDDFFQLLVGRKDDHIQLEVRPKPGDPRDPFKREMTEGEWEDLLEQLYGRLYLHEWNRVFIRRNDPDGERWELDVRLTRDRADRYMGLGGCPPYWEELQQVFRPFFCEAGITL